ncbi:hypothetical protein [Paraherbaspirillum soli]|uniref:Uncharacterized protein n=1 Tax=Paraherbaspirillum soli TaxID=631222 RepID=A0ABW0MAL2_9BURK
MTTISSRPVIPPYLSEIYSTATRSASIPTLQTEASPAEPTRASQPPKQTPAQKTLNKEAERLEKLKGKRNSLQFQNFEKFTDAFTGSKRPIVHFPPSARGDMNAYKYTAFLDNKDRPLAIFQYFDNPNPESEQEAFNRNLFAIQEHLSSLGDRFKEGHDYIFGTQVVVNHFKDLAKSENLAGEQRVKHYQQYDNIMQNPEVRTKVHAMFKNMIASDTNIREYLVKKEVLSNDVASENQIPESKLANKLPSDGVASENQIPESKLILININKRASQDAWNPREYRHTTPDDAHMQSLIGGIYDAQTAIGGKKNELEISFVGSTFNEQAQQHWREYGQENGVKVHFFNDMQQEGLDRNQQRAALFALTDRYKSTTYLGHQSGVNEDAQILQRTNVYSLSEYLDRGQVGISRVEARPQLDDVRTSGVDMAAGANSRGNFYSLRNSEFLTTEGILAAVQIKLNEKSNAHRPLDALWTELTEKYTTDTGRNSSEMATVEATNKLFEMILEDAGKRSVKTIPTEISEEEKTRLEYTGKWNDKTMLTDISQKELNSLNKTREKKFETMSADISEEEFNRRKEAELMKFKIIPAHNSEDELNRLKSDGKKKVEIIAAEISEDMDNYKSAIGVIVQRKKTNESGLSPAAKQYFTDTMKEELTRHDSTDPVTRHYDKLRSHNDGMRPYTLANKEKENREPTGKNDDYLKSLFPTK